MSHFNLLQVSVVAVLCILSQREALGTNPIASAVPRYPNILFLMADEFRHDCLSAAGHPIVKTPNLARPEMYNLARDPHERHNLYGNQEVARVRAELEAALQSWWKQNPAPVTLPVTNSR